MDHVAATEWHFKLIKCTKIKPYSCKKIHFIILYQSESDEVIIYLLFGFASTFRLLFLGDILSGKTDLQFSSSVDEKSLAVKSYFLGSLVSWFLEINGFRTGISWSEIDMEEVGSKVFRFCRKFLFSFIFSQCSSELSSNKFSVFRSDPDTTKLSENNFIGL